MFLYIYISILNGIDSTGCAVFLQGAEMWDDALLTLVPGEEVHVQVAVKCAHRDNAGHWSRWSESVRAAVPQSAGVCHSLCKVMFWVFFFSKSNMIQ